MTDQLTWLRLGGVWAFARVALREAMAAGLAWAALVYLALVLSAGWLLPVVAEGDRARAVLEATLALNFAVCLASLVPIASVSLAREFTRRIDLTITVKPVSALARVMGKFLGFAFAAMLLATTNAALGFLALTAGIEPALLAFAGPRTLATGEARVFASPDDQRPRPMRSSEAFDPAASPRPVWVFRGREVGGAHLALHLDVRQRNYTTPTGHVFVVARHGHAAPVRQRVQLFADRVSEVVVRPPGEGPLSVVLDPVGGAVIYPQPTSVAAVAARGSLWRNYALAHVGVLEVTWLAIAVSLFFSATCSSRVALLYAAVVLVACATVGPMRSFARVLGDGDTALQLLEQSFASAGEDIQAPPEVETANPARWAALQLLLRAMAAVLPDLGRHDHRTQLVGGVQLSFPHRRLPLVQLGLYLPLALGLAAAGLAGTPREGRS